MHEPDTHTDIGSSGRWEVITETSLYVLDLADGRCVRVPDAGLGSVEGLPPAQIAALRRAHHVTPLVSAAQVIIGRRLVFIRARRTLSNAEASGWQPPARRPAAAGIGTGNPQSISSDAYSASQEND